MIYFRLDLVRFPIKFPNPFRKLTTGNEKKNPLTCELSNSSSLVSTKWFLCRRSPLPRLLPVLPAKLFLLSVQLPPPWLVLAMEPSTAETTTAAAPPLAIFHKYRFFRDNVAESEFSWTLVFYFWQPLGITTFSVEIPINCEEFSFLSLLHFRIFFV